MGKNNYVKYATTLAIICLAASGLLSVVFNLAQPKILYQQSLEEKNSLKEVFPAATSFEPVEEKDNILYYKALDKKKEALGFVFKTSKRGYSSDIVTMAGMDQNGVITYIKILSQNETPGLGSRITEVVGKETFWDVLLRRAKITQPPSPWFTAQFSGKKADELDRSIDAITGATISSRAVIESVQEKAKEILKRAHGR
ncbi:MAG: FMN-binding protein [Candidatus Omnitrophota bacterium]